MLAAKGNIEYTISDAEKSSYVKNGFDIFDDKGKKIADGEHKTISFEKYKELEKKYGSLKLDYEELEKQLESKTTDSSTIESLKIELKEKDDKIKELTDKLKGKNTENKL